jgi:type II secretory pathway pseudopilin PulG
MPRLAPSAPAFTILEILALLAVLGSTLAVSLPAARHQLDRTAVLAAREEVAGLFHRARAEAVARGGASLLLSADPPVVELAGGQELLARCRLEDQYGARLTMTLSGGRMEAALRFDALGLGRVASQTIRFSRGEAEAVLVVSSYGRLARP